MNDRLHTHVANKSSVTRGLAATLRTTLDRKYSGIMRAAQGEWERRYAGNDPSDACVTVRIASRGQSSFAGDLRRAA